MGKPISDFDEIKIRGIDVDKKARLIQMATAQNKSLNQFLLDYVTRLAERQEVMEMETKYSEVIGMMATVIEKNTQILNEVSLFIQVMTGGESDDQ
ncbi:MULTISPECIES: hypothetical protein [unclassified Enterococcus]|uniref:hypothetical protein n=1 Tax=unclassified Enterococcus TaxID=2608891 RepID=UPI003F268698